MWPTASVVVKHCSLCSSNCRRPDPSSFDRKSTFAHNQSMSTSPRSVRPDTSLKPRAPIERHIDRLAPNTRRHLSSATRDAFARSREQLSADLEHHWSGSLERLGGPAEDVLAVLELWLCLVAIEDAHLRDAERARTPDWQRVAVGRAMLFGLAAQVIGRLVELLSPEGEPTTEAPRT